MIISWILLAASGAFFSTWVKPVFPNPRWFNAHRILMAQSLIVGVLGFCFAFIAHAKGTIINGLIDFDHDVGSARLQLCDTISLFLCLFLLPPLFLPPSLSPSFLPSLPPSLPPSLSPSLLPPSLPLFVLGCQYDSFYFWNTCHVASLC